MLTQTRFAGSFLWNGELLRGGRSANVGIPNIISKGNLTCRPNMKKNGVSCIVELKDVLRVSCMNGRTSAQLFCAILLYIKSMACRV